MNNQTFDTLLARLPLFTATEAPINAQFLAALLREMDGEQEVAA